MLEDDADTCLSSFALFSLLHSLSLSGSLSTSERPEAAAGHAQRGVAGAIRAGQLQPRGERRGASASWRSRTGSPELKEEWKKGALRALCRFSLFFSTAPLACVFLSGRRKSTHARPLVKVENPALLFFPPRSFFPPMLSFEGALSIRRDAGGQLGAEPRGKSDGKIERFFSFKSLDLESQLSALFSPPSPLFVGLVGRQKPTARAWGATMGVASVARPESRAGGRPPPAVLDREKNLL